MKGFSNEFKTGLLVIVALVGAIWMLLKTGDFNLSKQEYEIGVVFNDVAGIEKDAPVQIAGVEVGRVLDINLKYDEGTKVLLKVCLSNYAKIRKDSEITISTLGLMGEKFVKIEGGSKDSEFIKPNTIVVGKDPFNFDKLAEQAGEIAKTLDDTLKDVKSFTNNLNSVVTDNKKGVSSIVSNLEATSQNFKDFSEDIKTHPWKLLMKGKEDSKVKK